MRSQPKFLQYNNALDLKSSLDALDDDPPETGESLSYLLNNRKRKKRTPEDPVAVLPNKRVKVTTTKATARIQATQVIEVPSSSSSLSSLEDYEIPEDDISPQHDPSVFSLLSLLNSTKSNIQGLSRTQNRAASVQFSALELEDMESSAGRNSRDRVIKLDFKMPNRTCSFSLKETDRFETLAPALASLLSCRQDQLQLKFYQIPVNLQDTPAYHKMASGDTLSCTLVSIPTSKEKPQTKPATKSSSHTIVAVGSDLDEPSQEEKEDNATLANEDEELERELEEKLRNAAATQSQSSSATNKIKLTIRIGGTTQKFRLGLNDPFSKLYESLGQKHPGKKISLKFDGEKLDPDETPADLDMDNDDQIDGNIN